MNLLIFCLFITLICYLSLRIRKKHKLNPNFSYNISTTKVEEKEVVSNNNQKIKEENNKIESKNESEDYDKLLDELGKISNRLIEILNKFDERGVDIFSDDIPDDLKPLKEEYEKLKQREQEIYNKLL